MKQVLHIKNCTMKNVSSTLLVVLGTIYLSLALFESWIYLFVACICYAAAILVKDLKNDAPQ